MTSTVMDLLVETGLADASGSHPLTPKGREWLAAMEELQTLDFEKDDAAADLVLSTNGIFR